MNKNLFQQLVRLLFCAITLLSLGCTKGNPIISVLPSNEPSGPTAPDGMVTIPPAVAGAPSIILTPYVGTAKISAFEITGACPKDATSVSATVNGGEATELTCQNDIYSGTLDLVNFSDGELSLVVSAVSGSTPTSVIKDTVPPTSPSPGALINWWIQPSVSPILNWSPATDSGSGIEKYQVRVIKQSDSFEISPWKDLASGNSISGLNLLDETFYVFEVRALDKAKNISTSSQSAAWQMDITPPLAPPSLDDGIMTFSNSVSPMMSWSTGADAGSGFANFEVAIGTTNGGSDVLGWTNVGSILTQSLNALSLSDSQKYFASVRSLDVAGNKSTAVLGDSWYNFGQSKLAIDSTIPQARWASINANYGQSLAISEDQTTLVIGVPNDDTDSSGGDFVSNAGAVFVYTKSGTTWVFQQKLVGVGTNARVANDYFGKSVAISGTTIVVGAPGQDYGSDGNIIGKKTDGGALYVFTNSLGTWSLQQKIVATETNAREYTDKLGESVDIENDTIIAGAPDQDADENGLIPISDAGAAYIFKRTSNIWSQVKKIVATDRDSVDFFGASVAISANTVVVGASNQDTDASSANPITDSGAAYIYVENSGFWTLQQKLVAIGTNARMANDHFGSKIAIDNDTVAIGVSDHAYDSDGSNQLFSAGAVYIYNRSGGTWTQSQKLTTPSYRSTQDEFGSDLAIEGNTLLIGATGHSKDSTDANPVTNAGAAYIFTYSTGWSLQKKISATGTNSRNQLDRFASSVALSGNNIAIGSPLQDSDASGSNRVADAGAAFAFTFEMGTWSQTQKLSDELVPQSRMNQELENFGDALAFSEDGNTLVVGVPLDSTNFNSVDFVSKAGAVYVYGRSGHSWILKQKLTASGLNARNENDYFGSSVGISGNTIAVGAPKHAYDKDGANHKGSAGALYIFNLIGTTWTQTQKLAPSGANARNFDDQFGGAIAISGNTLVVGAYKHGYDSSGDNSISSAGAAYVFTNNYTSWVQTAKLTAESFSGGRVSFDNFGYSVTISGSHIAIGAPEQDYDENGSNLLNGAGAVYTFRFDGVNWQPQQKLVGQGPNGRIGNDVFGTTVVLDGTNLIVGATGQDFDETGVNQLLTAGAAYAFEFSGGSWIFNQKLIATGSGGRGGFNYFGTALAISSNTLVIGASNNGYDQAGANYLLGAGAVFVYSRIASQWVQQLKLTPNGTNSRNAGDNFGRVLTVSEDSLNKTYSIGVGVPSHGFTSSGTNPIPNAGAVFLYH